MPHYHPTLAEIWTYPAEELAGKISAQRRKKQEAREVRQFDAFVGWRHEPDFRPTFSGQTVWSGTTSKRRIEIGCNIPADLNVSA